ncbi:MAG: DotA/TraY family protein [Alphaproteobacteria bacterium]|nr:DotA/TraY family protein [Alphaproteobacteria bacterium]
MATRNEILKYTMLPGFIPRIAALFRNAFAHTAYIIAIIFHNVRLLPYNHPYLLEENFGRYGIRHVIAQASSNLVYSRRNIDQIIIFYTILIGMALLVLQFVLLISAISATQPAFAIGVFTDFRDMFRNPSATAGSLGPDQDIAFIVLDHVFGLGDGTAANNWYNSCVSNLAVQCTDMNGVAMPSPSAYPFPFHDGLHQLLRFYSLGLLYVGAMVIIYLVTAVVAETAQTGVPFGQRFNKAWTPVRLILFFALLMPINVGGSNTIGAGGMNEGLNGAQLITFLVVKWGSNLATNAWSYFNTGGGAGGSPYVAFLDDQYELVGAPQIPEVTSLLKDVFVAKTCEALYAKKYRIDVHPYVVRSTPPQVMGFAPPGAGDLTPNDSDFLTTNYATAKDFVYQGNIEIVFGELGMADPEDATKLVSEYETYKGNVKPLCGSVTLQMQGTAERGSDQIFEGYYDTLQDIWQDPDFQSHAECLADQNLPQNQNPNCTPVLDDGTWAQGEKNAYKAVIEGIVQAAITDQRDNGTFISPPGILDRGWAGASIWYNRVAEMNGAVTTATLNIPKMTKIPMLMDNALRANLAQNKDISTGDLFDQNMANRLGLNVLFDIEDEDQRRMLATMDQANQYWVRGGNAVDSTFRRPTNNVLVEAANAILGTEGIFEMRRNTDVHPLAQLSSIGRSMMENTLRNTAYAAAAKATEIGTAQLDLGFEKNTAKAAGDFFIAMIAASLAISIILYYILPFLPFIYFMFALSGWVKSIFEAIVAMPLWALAHLRIDGEGVPGPGASNGYFLLLEIFLRPTLILVGFIASISIFSALVNVLNQIFDLVVSNVGGYDNELEQLIQDGAAAPKFISKLSVARGPIDEFFFTAIYAIICYLIGLACFKLVDLIPNNILRWMGVSVSTFQENAGDPAGQLTSNVYRGTNLTVNQVRGSVQGDLPNILG